jgi:hypothetical protein
MHLLERIVWGDVPAAAILYHISCSNLHDLSDRDPEYASILNLDKFRTGRNTGQVACQTRGKISTLSITITKFIGRIAQVFGMHRDSVNLAHIQGLIACLVDSFQITQNPRTDIYTSSTIAPKTTGLPLGA